MTKISVNASLITIKCEPGLTMRFMEHVCGAVSKVMFVVPGLLHLIFGTYKAAAGTNLKKKSTRYCAFVN